MSSATKNRTISDEMLQLEARTARDLMTSNVFSVNENTTTQQAADFLYRKSIGAAPVLDAAGRPVGVVSRSDIAWFHRAPAGHFEPHEYFYSESVPAEVGEPGPERVVREIMTPAVFTIKAATPIRDALDEMVRSQVHRLFVVDDEGTLVGVLSAMDVVKALCNA